MTTVHHGGHTTSNTGAPVLGSTPLINWSVQTGACDYDYERHLLMQLSDETLIDDISCFIAEEPTGVVAIVRQGLRTAAQSLGRSTLTAIVITFAVRLI